MIRNLETSELDGVCDLLERWYASSVTLAGTFNRDIFKQVWTALLNNDSGVIFGDNGGDSLSGVIGGFAHSDINTGDLTASECFWYVAPDSRGKGLDLLRTFEGWAKGKGCQRVRMSRLLEGDGRVDLIYKRRNYYPVEVTFIKEM